MFLLLPEGITLKHWYTEVLLNNVQVNDYVVYKVKKERKNRRTPYQLNPQLETIYSLNSKFYLKTQK